MTRSTSTARLMAAVVLLASAQAATAGGWGANYKAAAAEAKRSGKPILANFTGSDWCPYCIQLEKEVFSTAEFKKWADENVVLLTVDFPHRPLPASVAKQNEELGKKYNVGGYPTVLLLNADGEVLGKSGYRPGGPAPWIEGMDATVKASKPAPIVVETDVTGSIERAKSGGRALLLLIDAGESEALDKRAEMVLSDGAIHDLAASRLTVVRVKRGGSSATPADALAAVDAMLDAMKVAKTPARVVAVDLSGAEPKAIFDAPAMPTASILAARLEKGLPKLTYPGGWIEDYAAALAFARDMNRPVLLDFTGSDWCGWCIKLDKEVFSTPEFKAFADANLVLVKLDYPRRTEQDPAIKAQNAKLAAQYGIQGYPTILVLNSKGQQAGQLGYMPGGPDAFIAELKKIGK